MKKQIILTLAALLSLSGCGNVENASSQSMESTSASATTTTTVATTATTPVLTKVDISNMKIQVNVDDTQNFSTYAELMAAYKMKYPTNYEHPLPDIVNRWELRNTKLCASNYTLYYTDTQNQTRITLEIGFNSSYDTISEYFNGIAYSQGASVSEMNERYAIRHYSESDTYAIIGLTGEENIRYTLLVSSEDENADPIELLMEYKSLLNLG